METTIRTSFRQIRAKHDANTVTVYQAYSATIAIAAVENQKLNASPEFSSTRMTWIKPSWAWTLYRSGYSYKDARQSHILAITMTNEAFLSLLEKAVLAHGSDGLPEGQDRKASVRVQWDPERTIRLEKLPYRSIQIGIPGSLVSGFMEGIVRIEDVTEKARTLKKILDEEGEERVEMVKLVNGGLVPTETEFRIPESLRRILQMDAVKD